jgi:hypothetical protein
MAKESGTASTHHLEHNLSRKQDPTSGIMLADIEPI